MIRIIVGVVTPVVAAVVFSSGLQEPAAWQSRVSVTLEPITQQVLVGLPVSFTVVQENKTNAALESVHRRPIDSLRLKVKSARREIMIAVRERWLAGTAAEKSSDLMMELKPGMKVRYSFFVHTNAETGAYFFDSEEIVQATVTYRVGSEYVNSSNTITFQVKAPVGPELAVQTSLAGLPNRESVSAWKMPTDCLGSEQAALELKTRSAAEAAQIRTLLAANPQSAYAHLMRYYLAMLDFATSLEALPNEEREIRVFSQESFQRAKSELEALAQSNDFVLSPQALGQLSLMTRINDDALKRDGKKAFNQLSKTYAHTDYFLGEWVALVGLGDR